MAAPDELDARLARVLGAVLGLPATAIGPDTSRDTVGAWDSLRQMNLILALEEEFGVTIPDEDAAHLTSFPLARVVVRDLLAEGA